MRKRKLSHSFLFRQKDKGTVVNLTSQVINEGWIEITCTVPLIDFHLSVPIIGFHLWFRRSWDQSPEEEVRRDREGDGENSSPDGSCY